MMYRQVNLQTDKQTEGNTDGYIDRQMHRRIVECLDIPTKSIIEV
jgi:hypothetical protein